MKPFYFLIAWRNLWRNKKRTAIAVASITFAVFFACLMRSSQEGGYSRMIDNVAGIYSGYLRISELGYSDSPSFEKTISAEDSYLEKIKSVNGVTGVFPRIESSVLLSHDERTKGVLLMGIDPEAENQNNRLSGLMVAGTYLSTNSKGILLGKGVSEYLKVSVGDSVIVFGQDRYGSTAASVYPVMGIIKLASPYIDDRLIYIPLKQAQILFDCAERVSTIAVMISDPKSVNEIRTDLLSLSGDKLEVKRWNDLFPDMEQAITLDKVTGLIMIGILYAVIGFGIFGTIMMMTIERSREFAMCIAVGMKRYQLGITSVYESIMISFLGVITGIIAVFPILLYLHSNPIKFTGKDAEAYQKFNVEAIIPFSLDISIFISQAGIIFIMALIIAQYPLLKISRLNILNSLRG